MRKFRRSEYSVKVKVSNNIEEHRLQEKLQLLNREQKLVTRMVEKQEKEFRKRDTKLVNDNEIETVDDAILQRKEKQRSKRKRNNKKKLENLKGTETKIASKNDIDSNNKEVRKNKTKSLLPNRKKDESSFLPNINKFNHSISSYSESELDRQKGHKRKSRDLVLPPISNLCFSSCLSLPSLKKI